MFIVIVAVFFATWVSAASQGDNPNLPALVNEIAEERRQLTEKQMDAEHAQIDAEHAQIDAEHKQIDAEHKKMTKLFHDATTRLEEQHSTLKELNDELHQKIVQLRREIKNDKLQARIQNVKLQEQITKLRRENQVLRRADSEIKQTIRQRDHDTSRKFDASIEAKLDKSVKEQDHSELKKIVASEVENYLINGRICVGGAINSTDFPDTQEGRYTQEVVLEVPFGHTFPRIPTILASLTTIVNNNKSTKVWVHVKRVSTSSAVLYIKRYRKKNYHYKETQCNVGWLACL